jgi:foldase protein PrsA
MRISRKLAALGAFFVLAAAVVAGCGSSVGGNSVASMDGNKISVRAYKHWMFVAAKGNATEEEGSPVIAPSDPPNFTSCISQVRKQLPELAKTSTKEVKADCSQLFTQLNSEVMSFLIESYWYQADAHKLGITLTDKQMTKAYDAAKKAQFPTAKQYTAFLTESGQTDADIRFRVRVNTLYERLVKRYTKKVTTADIASYYKAHESEFGTPETRNIRIVLTKTQGNAQSALTALKSGASWDTVAKKYSTDASSKDNGGLLTGIEEGQEEHALNAVAFSAPLNKLEGPVHGTFGWYVVQVVKITPATHESQAKSTKLIKQELKQQNETAAENQVTKLSKKDWGKQTTCAKLYQTATYCANYKAPPKTTPAATPTPTVSTPAVTSSTPAVTSSTPATTSSPATTSTPAATTSTPAATTSTPSTTTTSSK